MKEKDAKKQQSKLEKEYDQINNPNKTLEEIEKVSVSVHIVPIQDYQMKEGDYKIIITIYEGQELEPHDAKLFNLFDLKKSAVDAFVEIQIMGQTRKTAARKETNNPIWQESFYFAFQNLSVNDLDQAKIAINVHDKNNLVTKNSHIGRIQLDWTNIYFRRFHEIYRGWLTLSDPNEQNLGTVGYILCNIAVLGPEDKVMVHDTAFIKDPLTTIEDTITNSKVKLIDYSITAEVYRAESLVPLDLFSRNVDAYVVAKFSGNKVMTNTVKGTLNPEWNKALKLGLGVPNKSKYLYLQVWNHNYYPKKHDLIGVIKIPFIDICENKFNTPRWGHMYGPPLCAKDEPPNNYASKMELYGEQLGSHYRGRILFKVVGKKYVHSQNGMSQIKFKFPYKPTPVVALKTYTLSVELIEGFHLPEKNEAQIIVSMGQYLMRATKKFVLHKQKRICEFQHILEDKKVQFAEDISQVPDIIIYLCDGPEEKNRMSFVRIKASHVETPIRIKNSEIYELSGDKSLGRLEPFEIGGYLNARVNLYTNGAPAVKTIEQELKEKVNFEMFLYIYKGENFPPAKVPGDCDPVLKFNCFGATAESKEKKGTYNPFWADTVSIGDIFMQDIFTTNITKGVVVEAFNRSGKGKDQFIGSFLIKVNSKGLTHFKPGDKDRKEAQIQSRVCAENMKNVDFIYMKPKWFYIMNPHIEIGKHIFGKVLIGVALFKRQDLLNERIPKYRYDFQYRQSQNAKRKGDSSKEQFKKLVEFQSRKLQVYVIGLRNIKNDKKKVLTAGTGSLSISFHSTKQELQPPLISEKLKRSGCDINKLIEVDVEIPKNRTLTPFIDFRVLHDDVFYGFNSISLYKLVPKLKEKDGSNANAYHDSEDTILDVEGLENQLNMLRQKKKREQEEKNGLLEEQINIKSLAIPPEIGHLNGDEQKLEENNEFAKILTHLQVELQEGKGADYCYVKQLMDCKENAVHPKPPEFDLNHIREEDNPSYNPSNQDLMSNLVLHTEKKVDEEKEGLLERQKLQNMSRQSISKVSKGGSEMNIKGAQNFKLGETVFQKRKKKKQDMVIKDLNNFKTGQPFLKKEQEKKPNNIGNMIEEVPEEKEREDKYQQIESSKQINGERQSQPSKREKNILEYGDPEGSQEDQARFKIVSNNEKGMTKDYNDAANRYDPEYRANTNHADQVDLPNQFGNDGSRAESVNFEVRTEDVYEDHEVEERAVKYAQVQRVMKQEERDQKQALQRQKEYKFAQAVKLTLFGWNRKKKKRNIETYEDYDSEVGQDLNIIPEWYKGRKILTSDFEDLSFKCSKIHTIPLFGGKMLQKTTIYQRYKESAGHVKLICLSEATQVAKEKEQQYTKLLRPRQFYCRIYCLKGKSLISHYDGKPTTFLKFSYADQEWSFVKTRKVENENNPEYYICQEVQVDLPGPSVIKIQVMETHDILGRLVTKTLGYTQLDVELRYFTKKWHLYEKKPIELRNLYSQYGIGTQGRLETWVDLIEKKKWINTPAHKIHPPPFDKYELRVIVWKTDDCVYKNVEMESNDIFVRGVIGTSEPQQTDTHWACRSVGSFNYRFKFPVFYPPKPEDMYSDIFAVQIWDRDLIGYNNLIGETRVNLNQVHKIIQKAVKRRKPVKASMKVKEKNFSITDKFWYDVYNHKEKDQFGIPQPQGRVQLGFELVPFEKAEDDLKNGYGRSEPNVYPTMPEPEGRLQFDFFSPLAFLKQILGPNLYRKCCCKIVCCLIIVILGVFAYIFLPTFIAVKI